MPNVNNVRRVETTKLLATGCPSACRQNDEVRCTDASNNRNIHKVSSHGAMNVWDRYDYGVGRMSTMTGLETTVATT